MSEDLVKEADPTVECMFCMFFNPLPDMPILGFSNSAANKDKMSNIWTNGGTTF